MGKKHHLADLQMAIMQVLWDRGEATVGEVREALARARRPLAYTTVGTMLAKMERNGHVAHRAEGRANIYRPLVKKEQVSRSMTGDLLDRLFGGDVADMVCHLLDECDVSPEELARLKRLIRQKEQELKDEQ
jgi:BlaI family transcriptional regulator, penicillinase repressor